MDDATMQGMELESLINQIQRGADAGQASGNGSDEEGEQSTRQLLANRNASLSRSDIIKNEREKQKY